MINNLHMIELIPPYFPRVEKELPRMMTLTMTMMMMMTRTGTINRVNSCLGTKLTYVIKRKTKQQTSSIKHIFLFFVLDFRPFRERMEKTGKRKNSRFLLK